MNAVHLIADIRDYPWRNLVAGLLPARFQPKTTQIVPSASIAGNALTVVIAIMSFLACLTAGLVYMVNQSAEAWVKDLSSEITIELDPVNTADIEKKMTLEVPYKRVETADDWLPCCFGGYMTMPTYYQRGTYGFGSNVKGVFDCTCFKTPAAAEFPRVY